MEENSGNIHARDPHACGERRPPARGGAAAGEAVGSAAPQAPGGRPDHYKVICISFYNEDLEHLDEVVRGLKSRGLTKANRSAVLREAMRQFDPSRVGRGL